jgi:citrate synthase
MTDAAGPRTRTVADVMSSPAITASPRESVAEVAERMSANRLGSVVVVEDRRPVGILTERDLVRFAGSGADASVTKVAEWMTERPDVVAPEVEVTEAWRNLAERGYRHIPVVEDTELVGVVSMRDVMRVAQIRPVEQAVTDVPKGLEGVVVAETSIGDVRGLEGFYHYRQYSAVELAEKRSLEDVWYLVFFGSLPDAATSEQFRRRIRANRTIPDSVRPLLPAIASAGESFVALDALRSAVSVCASSLGFRASLDLDAAELVDEAMQVCALVPTLVMALYRLSQGQQPIEPHPDLDYAANYLYMLTGEVPDPVKARALEKYLISTIDHGFNSSTFTARVITSTGADLGAAVVGAIGALSGPLHGGAPSRALDMLDAIGRPENADAHIRGIVEHGGRIMGFGHRVYKTDDPRSLMLRQVAIDLGGPLTDFAREVEATVVRVLAELKPGRSLYTNVEFYAGVVMSECGIPRTLFTPTFASSRTIGWCAHILEQAGDNRLIRPSAHYVGPAPPQPVPDPS